MKRFVIAAAVALTLGFVSTGKADAQYFYGYRGYAGGGIVSGRTAYSPYAYGATNRYYSPYYGSYQRQSYYTNAYGQTSARGYGYNPITGLGYNYNYYQPNYYSPVYGGSNYGYSGW